MTSIIATVNPDGASVTLVLTPTESVAAITRTDGNGNAAIRLPAGTMPTAAPLTVVDYEAALQGTVTYSVPGASTAVELPATQPWLVFPLRPSQSVQLEQVTNYSAARVSLGTLHQVPDRTDPLAALGRLAQRTGQLAILCDSHATARLLESRLDLSGLGMLKEAEHAGLDMYFIPTGTSPEYDTDADQWTLTVDYTEISRPTSPINANVWTFGTVATSYSSFANVTSNYEDFEMLSLNDQAGVI